MTRARALADLANSGVFSPNAGLSRVGINSTSPSVTLDVGGGASFAGNVSVGGTLTYDDVTNIDSVGIITAQSGIHVTGGSVGIGTNNPVGNLEVRDSKANLIVAKDGLTVKANSAFHTSYDNVQLGAGGGLASYSTATATADTQFLHNAYRHSGGNWKYRYADTAARLRVNSPGRTWIFESAASGSADGDITFSEQLRITSNGDLMTGGITSGAGKVQVGGGLRIAGSATHTDTNSPYIYRTSGVDNLCISTSALERLRIKSDGNVGVGYDDPSEKLVIKGTTSLMATNSTNRWMAYTFTDDTFRLNYNGAGADELTIDSSGRLLINTEVSRIVEDSSGNGPQGKLQIEGLNSDAMLSIIAAKQADTFRSGCISLGAHRGSLGGTPTILQNGDTVGGVLFAAGDGSDMRTKTAQIISQVDGSPSANDVPGRLVFSTRKGGGSLTEKLRLTSDGKLILSMTERTTPHGAQGDGAMFIEQSYDGNLYALMLRNKDTGASASTSLGFSLNRSGGDQDFESGKITIEKEQAWTTSSSTVDSAMTFSTGLNQSLAEKLRITSGGNIRIPFVDNGTGLRQKIQFVTEANYFDEVAYIAMNRTAVSSAPSDMVFATGSTLGVHERLTIGSNGSLRLTPEGSTADPNARIDTSGDNLRLVTMKDGAGGCGFIIETQTGGAVSERLRIQETGLFVHTGGAAANSGNATNGSYYRMNVYKSISANSSDTFRFSGLASGFMTIRGGGYSNAGQSQFSAMYQLGGYMAATNTYDAYEVRAWGNGVSITTSKSGTYFDVTLANGSGSYALAAYFTVECTNGGIKCQIL